MLGSHLPLLRQGAHPHQCLHGHMGAVDGRYVHEGETNIISEIPWKASKYGGRPSAVPTATSSALAAARRRKGKQSKEAQLTDYITDISVNGELGMDDKNTIDALVKHACAQTGVQLRMHTNNDKVVMGTWKHLASYDCSSSWACRTLPWFTGRGQEDTCRSQWTDRAGGHGQPFHHGAQ